jgi:uncharacterized membrane protein
LLPNAIGATGDGSGENHDHAAQIQAVRQRAYIGTAVYLAGLASQLSGEIMLISSQYGNSRDDMAVPLVLSGAALMIVGPIPSVIGEKRITKIMLREGINNMSFESRKHYSRSFVFQFLGILCNLFAIGMYEDNPRLSQIAAPAGLVLNVAAAYEKGYSAFHGIQYSHEAEQSLLNRTNFSFIPSNHGGILRLTVLF